MQLIQDSFDGQYSIKNYEPGKIIINQTAYTNNLIISPNQLITNWRPQNVTDITLADLTLIAELQPTLVIIGTSNHSFFAPAEWLAFFYQQQIGIECMTTSAACRTFMALAAEGRHVVAGLCL